MKHRNTLILALLASVAVCVAAYATQFDYLEVMTGGIRFGGTGDPGPNKIQFWGSYSYLDEVADIQAETGKLRLTGEDAVYVYSDSGASATRALLAATADGEARLRGKLQTGGQNTSNSGVTASKDGSAYIFSAIVTADTPAYALVKADNLGTAYMLSSAAAQVSCVADGDVIIKLGVPDEQQEQLGMGLESSFQSQQMQSVSEDRPLTIFEQEQLDLEPGMLTPYHEMDDFIEEQ